MNLWVESILFTIIFVLALIPPKYDPAVRLKKYVEKKRNGHTPKG